METLLLSRWQFGLTTIYHFLFVPLTLGLGWITAYMQTRWYISRDEVWRRHTKFWGKLFLINFAIGVVTGIVQEFQFGMNWSDYSRYVGDIFGAPLAIEALLAFFLESTFIGIWIFGEGKVSERVHLASIWLVAIGSNLSALWILLANGWMQNPVGYFINETTNRAELESFLSLITNPKGWVFFWHSITSGLATAGFLVLGVSAWHILKKKEAEFFKISFRIAAVAALAGSLLVGFTGHTQAQMTWRTQPMKFAAMEAQWKTEKPASFSILTIGDLSGRSEVWSIRIPYVTSILADNRLDTEIKGMDELQTESEKKYGAGNYIPLVVVTWWSFRLMVGIGTLMILLSFLAIYFTGSKRILPDRFLKLLIPAIALPIAANLFGWVLTEMGRQPWIVQGLLKTENALSPNLTRFDLWASLLIYVLLYGGLAAVNFYLMRKSAISSSADAMKH